MRRNSLALAVCAALSVAAQATTVAPMTLEELSDHSAAVVEGTIARVSSHWAGSPAEIISDVEFASVTYLKGGGASAASALHLTVPGGRIGDWEMRIAGAPAFEPGQRWLLFLLPSYRTFPVAGVWEGAFRIVTDPQGVKRVLSAHGKPIALSQAKSGQPVRNAVPYAVFREHLLPILERSKPFAQTRLIGERVWGSYTPGPLFSHSEHVNADHDEMKPVGPSDALYAQEPTSSEPRP